MWGRCHPKQVACCAKQHSEPTSDKRGAKADELTLTPLELIDRIAALALLALAQQALRQAESPSTGLLTPAPTLAGNAVMPKPEPVQPRRPAHYLWAALIARIYVVFPLLCPICGGQMRLISFITEGTQIRKILDHIGEDSAPRTSVLHTGHRCGTAVMRRRMTGCKASRIGIWPHNRPPITTSTSISAQVGD